MRIFICIALMFGFYVSNAQTPSDSIFVAKNFWGYKFYQKDTRLNFNQLPYVMEENSEAFNLITHAKSNNTISSIISGAGGFLLGWQLVTAAIGGDPNWVLAGVGGGLIVISIPVFSKSYRQSLEAVKMYNEGLSMSSQRLNLNFGASKNGIGIIIGF